MAEKLGLLSQWAFGNLAERGTINRNAETLSNVEAHVVDLRNLVERQANEITQLRAMFMGLVEVLHDKAVVDEAQLEHTIKAAWTKLSASTVQPHAPGGPQRDTPNAPGGPYRDTPSAAEDGPQPKRSRRPKRCSNRLRTINSAGSSRKPERFITR